ncbi:MAG: Ig-like domain-containing protein [Gemmatimonadota bacterium]
MKSKLADVPVDRASTARGWVPGLLTLPVLAITFLACARIAPPPGAQPDSKPPSLIATRPESLEITPNFHGNVVFEFDEVISEGTAPSQGLGTSDLEKQILLSPSPNVPVVEWKRNRLEVHPKEGWKPNRVYRVELLPGIVDLVRNRLDSGKVITFTTGAPVPTDTLRGRAIDWVGQRLAAGAVIEANLQPDSLVYRAVADSNGLYLLTPVPKGSYRTYAALDANHNFRRDPREAWDSSSVLEDSARVPDLWIFPRDTVGPRIQGITANDTLSATITFSGPLDPYQRLDSTSARLVLLPDSTSVPVASLRSKILDDSLEQVARAARDTTRKTDTAVVSTPAKRPQPPPARPLPRGQRAVVIDTATARRLLATRPVPFDKLVLRPVEPFKRGSKYALIIRGARNMNRVAADARNGFEMPKAVEHPPTAASGDSTAARPDSVTRDSAGTVRPDSAHAVPPPSRP